MSESKIGIFLRLRPPRRSASRVATDTKESWVEFNIPRDASQGLINNSKESYKFHFDGVFPPDVQQDVIFETIAKPAISDALDGINGTVFAYGQTGSGKTFTVTGGTERYADRGLIPRAVSTIFQEIKNRSTYSFQVSISYLELYNEEGFDLLDPSREVKRMEDLPKVLVMEDDDSRMHVRNLSIHCTASEEEALNLLFLGDTNRMVAETPLNQASSRSHAIFTISIESRKAGDDCVRRSKLNIVDLAGSERVTKTGIEGKILHEAKYINLSLHYLEQVIISLQEHRPHVPYRNSLLTQMLKDSLGGNCRTVMIANIAPDTQHIEESISTCRFAQRVAMIKNKVTVNEEIDPRLLIRRLRQENQQLRTELLLLKGINREGGDVEDSEEQKQPWQQLSEEEESRIEQRIMAYIENVSPDATMDIEASMVFIQRAFSLFKSMVRNARSSRSQMKRAPFPGRADNPDQHDISTGSPEDQHEDFSNQLESLQKTLRQKEREVAILAGMLRKQGTVLQGDLALEIPQGGNFRNSMHVDDKTHQTGSSSMVNDGGRYTGSIPASAGPYHDGMLQDKNKAFEYFCTSSTMHDHIIESKAFLKEKYDNAKLLGSRVQASKQRMGELRNLIEQRRVQRSMAAYMQGEIATSNDDPEEEKAKILIEKEKVLYREGLRQLKVVKSEIDQLQALLNHSRAKLQREFATWYDVMLNQLSLDERQQIERQQGQQQQTRSKHHGMWQTSAVHNELEIGSANDNVHLQQEYQSAPRPSSAAERALQFTFSIHNTTESADIVRPVAHNQTTNAGGPQNLIQTGELRLPSSLSLNVSPTHQQSKHSRPGSRLKDTGATPGASQATWPVVTSTSCMLPTSSTLGNVQQQQTYLTRTQSPAVGTPDPRMKHMSTRDRPLEEAVGTEYEGVEPEVLEAARPLLTGNSAADADIIRFYQARADLLKAQLKH